MNVIPVSDRDFSGRAMRLFTVTVTFLCVGLIILTILWVTLNFVYLKFIGLGETLSPLSGMALMLFVAALFPFIAVAAALTGLIAGFSEIYFGRLNARSMFAISVIVPYAFTYLQWLTIPHAAAIPEAKVLPLILIIPQLSFAAAMMACWKITGTPGGKTAAEERPSA